MTIVVSGSWIYENTFLDNVTQAYDGSALIFTNHWDDGSRGNRWSDYAGQDTDLDGIGDTPYRIPPYEDAASLPFTVKGTKDNYPLVEVRRVFVPLVLRGR